jgi:hypothetical protein
MPSLSSAFKAAPLLTPAFIATLVFAFALWPHQMLNDVDSIWHLEAGRLMVANGHILKTDPFSHSFAGQPWHTHEWLGEVIMALIHKLSGWSGVMAFTAACVALTAYSAALYAQRWLKGLPLILLIFFGLLLIGPHYLARPHIWVLPCLSFWMLGLLTARDQNRSPALWLLGLMALWANMHASFILGLCLIGPFALEALIKASADQRRSTLISWGGFAVLATLAGHISPHGLEGFIFPLKLMFMPGISGISEWAPADLTKMSGLLLSFLTFMFIALRYGLKLEPLRLVLLLGLLFATLRQERHQMVLGIVSIFVLAEPLAQALSTQIPIHLMPILATKPEFKKSWVIIGVMITALLGLRLSLPVVEISNNNTPTQAVKAVPKDLRAKNVLNDYDVGGYLIGQGIKTFIDGRTDMFGPQFLQQYNRLRQGDNRILDQVLKTYKIEWTLFRRHSPPANLMELKPEFERLYVDDSYVIHRRIIIKITPKGS